MVGCDCDMNPQNLENPDPVPQAGPPRLATTTQTYLTTPGGFLAAARGTTVHTTSTYLSPPWSWSTIRHAPPDNLVPLAVLAVIVAALVAIVAMVVLVTVVLIKAL